MNNHYLLVVLMTFFFSFNSEAQLDSTSIAVTIIDDTLNNAQLAVVTVFLDDASDLGQINIVVYDDATGTVIAESTKTREELESLEYLFTDRLEYPLFSVSTGNSYRIEVSPVNLAGAYTKISNYTLTN